MVKYTHVQGKMSREDWQLVRIALTDRITKIEKIRKAQASHTGYHSNKLHYELYRCKDFLKRVKVSRQ